MSLMVVTKKRKLTGTTFGERLRESRDAAGLTQGELAGLLGINRVNLNQYERGKVVPSFEMACKLADALKVDISELRGEFRNTDSTE